jgi:hypothetical protein
MNTHIALTYITMSVGDRFRQSSLTMTTYGASVNRQRS